LHPNWICSRARTARQFTRNLRAKRSVLINEARNAF
jgi:hypothetical protein